MLKLSIYEKNLKFVALGDGVPNIPKEHIFLKKYFKTKIQSVFLHYYFFFGDKQNFCDHTGFHVDKSFVCKMSGKIEWLMDMYNTAKKNLDLDTLGKLQRKKISIINKFC